MNFGKYDYYNFFDLPVPYEKNGKIYLIYPAMMKDYILFHLWASVLLLDKNSIPDVKVISMNHLEYLIYATNEENFYIYKFGELLKLVMRKSNLDFVYGDDSETGRKIFKLGEYLVDEKESPILINGEKQYLWVESFNGSDFDNLKEIIVDQNCLEVPDESIQKELRDALQQAREYKQKLNNAKMASLEEQMICVMLATPLKLEDIYNLSIRKFSKILERADNLIHYKIYLAASMSGMVEFKDKSFIKHWMTDLTPPLYGDVIVDPEEVNKKIR